MPGTHPRTTHRALIRRQQSVPDALRRLWGRDHSVEAAVDLCDDLLADLDALITVAVSGIEQQLPWIDIAEDALDRKRRVYDDLIGFCSVRSTELARVLHRSSLRDLADSADRIRVALSRASVPPRALPARCVA